MCNYDANIFLEFSGAKKFFVVHTYINFAIHYSFV